MNNQHSIKNFLLISEYYRKPFPLLLYRKLGFNIQDLPTTHSLINSYIFQQPIDKHKAKVLANVYKAETSRKIKIAKTYLFGLYLLPFVYMIGISGSVGMKTPEKYDDIDIFIICDKNALWLTRIIDFSLYTLLGKRRTHIIKNKKIKDKLCINKYLSIQALTIDEKNIYTALQIISITPIYGKGIYKRMLKQNAWITEFAPKFRFENNRFNLIFNIKQSITIISYPIIFICNFFAKQFQQTLLKRNPTNSYYFNKFTIETYNKQASEKLKSVLTKADIK